MGYEYEGPKDSTRLAIEFLNVWMDRDREAAAAHIAGVLDAEDGPSTDFVIAGLLNLSHFLVLERAKAKGATGTEDVERQAREFLSYLSLHLPEPW